MGREMDMEIINEILNEEKISWAIKTFHPFKSAGPDVIRPIMLQAVCEHLLPWLLKIFRGCLTTEYVPKGWREVRVAFIPKAGKINHCSPKDQRTDPSVFHRFNLKRWSDYWICTSGLS